MYTDGPLAPRESLRGVSGPVYDRCIASLRIAGDSGVPAIAAWWTVRSDSSAVLMTSRVVSGGSWSAPVVADSTDRGTRGCGRPPPAISVDPVSGSAHLAYFLEPASGGGVFFAHSMDSGSTWHAPIPIVFGRHPARASVASRGDRVAVAYEDPNAEQPLIDVALSTSMGHIFEDRVLASSPNGRARQPVVRLTGDSVHVWWSEYSPNPAVSATRPRYRAAKWK